MCRAIMYDFKFAVFTIKFFRYSVITLFHTHSKLMFAWTCISTHIYIVRYENMRTICCDSEAPIYFFAKQIIYRIDQILFGMTPILAVNCMPSYASHPSEKLVEDSDSRNWRARQNGNWKISCDNTESSLKSIIYNNVQGVVIYICCSFR